MYYTNYINTCSTNFVVKLFLNDIPSIIINNYAILVMCDFNIEIPPLLYYFFLKQLKLASTMVDLLRKLLFLFCSQNLSHSCLKTSILQVELSFYQLISQFQTAFYFFYEITLLYLFEKVSTLAFQSISTNVDSTFKV